MQNNNKKADCKAHPIAWLVQQRLLHPLTKKASQVKTCEAF